MTLKEKLAIKSLILLVAGGIFKMKLKRKQNVFCFIFSKDKKKHYINVF